MITRDEFKQRVRSFTWSSHDDLAAPDSPLWMMEQHKQIQPEWFICVEQDIVKENAKDYWNWCDTYLSGDIICYLSSNIDGEWWGFTNKNDVVHWLLKWGA